MRRKKVVSYRNSTSNHNVGYTFRVKRTVVSYRNSTSNHNRRRECWTHVVVVSYRNSTSNHNVTTDKIVGAALYLIEILHQTTTVEQSPFWSTCCILSKFYIKPQQTFAQNAPTKVVSYRNSTSNHNRRCCVRRERDVVSYRNSTSNHNDTRLGFFDLWLYLIEILHQTTTDLRTERTHQTLYLIEILHQTTTRVPLKLTTTRLYLIEILHQTTTSGLILIDKVLLTGCLPL